MSIIHLLPEHVANQIAAGEVIQRPASVVKELMENSIDAGATFVQLNLKDAGKTLIQVVDDGDGMTPEDAVKCFQRHATSKLKSADDLFQLQTKGFRGEALASIASIAHVSMRTKKDGVDTGTLIEVEGNAIKTNEQIVCSKGTSFEVKNLFYNVPARRNFLKSEGIEFGHIRDEFERVALAHPDIKFSLHHNGQEIYQLQAGVLRMRVASIFGRNSNERLVPLEEQTNIVSIKGFLGKPDAAKKTRGEQFFFVNHRFFKDSYFHHAISKAFEGMISEKHFPSYCIYLEVDPAKIDVNIHPTKTEIKFEEDRFIYSILLSSVRQALGKYNIFPTLDFETETSFDVPSSFRKTEPVEPQINVDPSFNPFQTQKFSNGSSGNGFTKALKNEGFGQAMPSPSEWEQFYHIEESSPVQQTSNSESLDFENEASHGNYLIHDRYVFSPTKSGLLVIDVKRAKWRILYDELIGKFIHQALDSQQLLFPIEKHVSNVEIDLWSNHEKLLQQLGFHCTINGTMLSIHGVPSVLPENSIDSCIDSLLADLQNRDIDQGDVAHYLVRRLTQNAAKDAQVRGTAEAQALVESLFQCEEHALAPNGKKVMHTVSLVDISSNF
ncbi:MAG: DNA mismatch repair endonuclease MutL [Crocinitomicaceae bacterium]|nr:DNA mismatch repair endonuclease MutL [Crocinitomicaceae bacterium]